MVHTNEIPDAAVYIQFKRKQEKSQHDNIVVVVVLHKSTQNGGKISL